MFEKLFTNPRTIERYRSAPLVEPRERYLRHLAEAGISRLELRVTALDQVRLLQLPDLCEGEKVTVARIEALAVEWDGTRRHKLSRDDIRRLLATTDGDRPVHKRDRAILLLLIVYGLRAGEVRRYSAATIRMRTRVASFRNAPDPLSRCLSTMFLLM